MTERPEAHDATTSDALAAEAPAEPAGRVPAATGSTTTYTTGTLEPGELGPAVTKPEGEAPTPGEGPIDRPIEAEDAEEFKQARQNRDQ